METEWTGAIIGAATAASLALAAGLASQRHPAIRSLVTLMVVAGYGILLAVTTAYAAACSGCTSRISYDSTRVADLFAAFFLGAMFAAGILVCLYVGAGLSAIVCMLTRSRGDDDARAVR